MTEWMGKAVLEGGKMPRNVAAGAFALGLLAALLAGWAVAESNRTQRQARFDVLAGRVADALAARMQMYEHGLRGARGAVIAAGIETVTRQRFDRYSQSRDYPREFPGVRGYGFIQRVPAGQQAAFEQAARLDGAPGFRVRQLHPHQGDRFVVRYFQPEAGSRKAIGVDIASEPARRQAALRAARSGEAMITSPISLLQESAGPATGFLLLLPVYREGMPLQTPQQRWDATFGWAYASLNLREVLAGFGDRAQEYHLSLVDVEASEAPFYQEGQAPAPAQAGAQATRFVDPYGRHWALKLRATPAFVRGLNQTPPWLVGVLVALISLLLSALLYLYLTGRRRRDEVALEQARLAALVRNASDAIVAEDPHGRITHWNDAAERLFGYSRAEALGHSLAGLIGDDSGDADTAPGKEPRQAGSRQSLRHHRDGHEVQVLESGAPIQGRHGEPSGYSRIFHDLSDRIHAEQRFRQVADASPSAMLVVDAEGTITLANRRAEELFGIAREALLGNSLDTLLPPEVQPRHRQYMRGYFADPQARPMGVGRDLFGVGRDGSRFPIEIGLSPIPTPEGVQVLASIIDISERKRHEARILELNATLEQQVAERTRELVTYSALQRAILAHAGYAIIAADPDGVITLFNPAAEKMLGYSASEMIGRKGSTMLHDPDELAARARALAGELNLPVDAGFENVVALSTLGRSDTNEWTYIRKDGRRIPVLLTVSTLRDDAENLIGYLGVGVDLTERKLKEQQLTRAITAAENANRSKSDFLANMSHEIRTPMNAILGMLYLLERSELPPAAREMTRKIDVSARALLSIINDVLDFSKIESGRIDLESEPFDLGELLENIATLMTSAISAKPVEMVVETPPADARWLSGDALRLGQVLINLVGNAIKFTERGEIVLSVRRFRSDEAGKVKLLFSIRDTGMGIPREKQDVIFSPFHQADTSTTRRFGGSGLGLTISRRLVELMGGQLQVDSAPGRGSEFYFAISLPTTQPPVLPSRGLPRRVLIADDHDLARNNLVNIIEGFGWQAEAVAGGTAALARVSVAPDAQEPFDLVVLDWRMPDLDGVAVAQALRQRGALEERQPVIIMVTAYERGQLEQALPQGLVDAVLTKPATSSSLYNAIGEALARRGAAVHLGTPKPEKRRLSGLRLLVVDDSEYNREVAQRILEAEGALVELADNGRQAVDTLAAGPERFDLVLMDVQMPVMDGYQATRTIRASPAISHIPVIALTAGAFKQQQEAAVVSGMSGFVAKPFDVDLLVSAILRLAPPARLSAATPAPALPAPQAPAPSPDLVDSERGLAQWNEAGPYKKYLLRLLSEYPDPAGDLAALVRRGDTAGAISHAHKLRGAAASLALPQVTAAAALVEETLQGGGSVEAGLRQLRQAMQRTAEAIVEFVGQGDADAAASTALDMAVASQDPDLAPEIPAQLRSVLAALDSDDPDQVDLALAQLEPMLPARLSGELRSLVDAFAFREAEARVRDWLETFTDAGAGLVGPRPAAEPGLE